MARIRRALEDAIRELATAAAALQAKGVDTTSLGSPVARISEALAQLDLLQTRSNTPD